MKGQYQIELNSGRKITLEIIFQYSTYLGLIEGYPTTKLNQSLIEEAQVHAKEKLWSWGNPFLIKPIETPLQQWEGIRGYGQPAEIPGITCLASFKSYPPARDNTECYSFLDLVWFQNQFALPIDPSVVVQIKAINWNLVANDASD